MPQLKHISPPTAAYSLLIFETLTVFAVNTSNNPLSQIVFCEGRLLVGDCFAPLVWNAHQCHVWILLFYDVSHCRLNWETQITFPCLNTMFLKAFEPSSRRLSAVQSELASSLGGIQPTKRAFIYSQHTDAQIASTIVWESYHPVTE